jgi:hypothetical protein
MGVRGYATMRGESFLNFAATGLIGGSGMGSFGYC